LKPDNQPVSFEPYLAAIHPDDQDRAEEARERALDGSGDYSLDHRIIRSDGEERVVHVQVAV
jgi:hypothetical protein